MRKNSHLATLGSIIFPDFAISDIAKLAIIIAFWHKKREEALAQRSLLMLDVEWLREKGGLQVFNGVSQNRVQR